MSKLSQAAHGRLVSLDYLRGYFVAVIILDHIWKFPSLWTAFTGQAKLWVTAAEGFVLISGYLIGYIRGHKGMKLPFRDIAYKLASRAGILYLWLIIATLFFVAIKWYVTIVPYVPAPSADKGDWLTAFVDVATLRHPAVWVHFLALYAIFLVLSIGAVWLMRRRMVWALALISIAVYTLGLLFDSEWMKWQILFFFASIAGFYHHDIKAWWQTTRYRRLLTFGLYAITLFTLALSIVSVYLPHLLPAGTADTLNKIFVIELFGPLRVILSMVWFTALALLFQGIYPLLARASFGVLEYIGTHSLTAYIVHGVIISIINIVITQLGLIENFWTNSLYGLAAVIMVYGLIRIPFVAKVVPR